MNEDTIVFDRNYGIPFHVDDYYYGNTYVPQNISIGKFLDEINHRTRQLEEQLDIVGNKENKQFIKGRLFELNEIKNNILNGYWVCDREPREYISF